VPATSADGRELATRVAEVCRELSERSEGARHDVEEQVALLEGSFAVLRRLARVVREGSADSDEAPYLLKQLQQQVYEEIAQLLVARDLLEKETVKPLHRLPSFVERRGGRVPLDTGAGADGETSVPAEGAGESFRAIFPVQDPEGWLVISKGGSPPRPEPEAPPPVTPVIVPPDADPAGAPAARFEAELNAGTPVEEALGRYLEALAARNGALPIRVRSRDDQRRLRHLEHETIAAALAERGDDRLAVDGRLAELRDLVIDRDWPTPDLDKLRPLAFLWFAVIQAADGEPKALDLCHPELTPEDVAALEPRLEPDDRQKLLELIPRLPPNAFLRTFPAAEVLSRRTGDGALRDWPCGVKDVFALGRTTAASAILEGFDSRIEATVVERLRRAGCLFPGKTNLDEFALGSLNESSAFKPTPGVPGHRLRVAGGSSGGSAAAVAAGLVRFAVGSDTAGSIRVPSAFCGVVGWKPSYGVIPRYGLLPLSMGLDVVGTLTRDVADTVEVASVLIGADPRDETTRGVPATDVGAAVRAMEGERFTVGVPIEYFLNVNRWTLPLYEQLIGGHRIEDFDALRALPARVKAAAAEGRARETATGGDQAWESLERLDKFASIPGYWDRFRELLLRLGDHGLEWRLVSLPHTWLSIPTYFALSRAELASSLHRYDGVTFGRRAANTPYDRVQSATRAESFGFQPKVRILMGIHGLRQKMARENGDVTADFLELSKRARRRIHDDFDAVFAEGKVHALLTPTINLPALPYGGSPDTVAEQRLDELTVPADLAGTPAISLPFGTVHETEHFPEREAPELPASIQVVAPRFEDARLLAVAGRIEALVRTPDAGGRQDR